MKYIIAIDGGGSKTLGHVYPSDAFSPFTQEHSTDSALLKGEITPICSYRSGASSLSADFTQSINTLVELIDCLIDQVSESITNGPMPDFVVSLGLAGAGSKALTQKALTALQSELFKRDSAVCQLILMEDSVSSLLGATLIAHSKLIHSESVRLVTLGTGSFVATYHQDSTVHFTGGWGFPIGDEGGGARLGQLAVRAYLQYLDKYQASNSNDAKLSENPSDFINDLATSLGKNRTDVLAWLSNAKQSDYAQLAPLVVDAINLPSPCSNAQYVWQQHLQLVRELLPTTNSNTFVTGGLAKATLEYLQDMGCGSLTYLPQPSITGAAFAACLFGPWQVQADKYYQLRNDFKQFVSTLSVDSNALTTSYSHSQSLQSDVSSSDSTDSSESRLTPLEQLVSESRNPNSMTLDEMNSEQIVHLMNQEDNQIAESLKPVLPQIGLAIDLIVTQLKLGGRLIYMGAGTSGRLGVLDAVECPPTFSTKSEQVIGLIAGGNTAMFKAVEGAEDNEQMGKDDLHHLRLTPNDVVVGIAASGRTPYVIGGIEYANQIGAPTITVTCNPTATLNQLSSVAIAANVGPEILTGSTRLKAGTAQKLILNRLSTGSLVQLGKCYENLMVDVNVSNNKLTLRAIRIIEQALKCDKQRAEQLLEQSDNNVKLAILMGKLNLTKSQAEQRLENANGFLRLAEKHSGDTPEDVKEMTDN
ncbi:N-acetylmuramic acid 6-phosphate etherase [Psychrosphaera ytuae]|nr:N-acetylmuramic acid 6-phosphate etherase [Psychrosphaera ytuae]